MNFKEIPLQISYKKIKDKILILLFVVSTISFSWTPLLALLPFLIIVSVLKFFYLKPTLNYLILLLIIILVFKSINTQTIYIEYIRSLIILTMFPIMYLCFYNVEYKLFLKILRVTFQSCIVTVLFIVFIEVPKNFGLFFGERRGFSANEYLFFGREFPFSLGVTHLNIYINFIFTFLFISFINEWQKTKTVILFVIFLLIAIATNSRSPILFLIVLALIYRKYILSRKRRSKLRRIKSYFYIFIFLLIGLFSYTYIVTLASTSERLADVSRLIFFAKGFEHMLLEPWGNSLLYIDPRMPLLNYHNTFLALGNRIGLWFFISLIISFIISIIYIRKIKKIKIRYAFFILLYFCFHNYMIEDVVKFDFFVLLVQFSIPPFLIFNKEIYLNE